MEPDPQVQQLTSTNMIQKIPDVHILVTCRNNDLKDFSLMVFKTLRVGFPTAKIHIHLNHLKKDFVAQAIEGIKVASITEYDFTIHHEWIERLIVNHNEPFWLVDTDVAFYDKVEDWKFDGGMAGYLIPEHYDKVTKCLTKSRLHTSLLYINPVELKELREKYLNSINRTEFNPMSNAVYPIVVPNDGMPVFYDTMSIMYHSIGGTPFNASQKDAYCHLHFGTFEDIALPHFEHGDVIKQIRRSILESPALGKGLWRQQDEYFESCKVVKDGVDVFKKPTPEEASVASEWKAKLCCNDVEAMRFCDLWYGYVHLIDDLVDTMKDGRPTMSKRQMISIFFQAAILYNNAFYRANQALLFPLILDITNSYTTSVLWEASPVAHKRQIADLLRMAGNRMYIMIALICGGEHHSQEVAQVIIEKDWLLQHDNNGNPI